jgi:Secretion system C-terminal sorting domain
MKHKITLSILLLNFYAFAQPIVDFSSFNSNGSGTAYSANPIGIIAGSAGANQTWDYSAVNLITTGPITTTVVTTAPFASSFPQANYFEKTNFNGTIYYIIAKNTANAKLEFLAFVTDTSILVNFSPNPQTQFEFPLSYNQTISDSYALSTDPTVNNFFTIQYDGYGTLITPFGTYNNVVRVKRLDGVFPVFSWYSVNPIREILNIQFGSSGVTGVQFTEYPSLGLNQNEKSNSVVLFPNPTSDSFSISSFKKDAFEYIIVDLVGKIIKQGISKSDEKITVENLQSGTNVIKIIDKEGNITNQKIIKS